MTTAWVLMMFVFGPTQSIEAVGVYKHESVCAQQAIVVARQNDQVRGPQRFYGCTQVHGMTQ